MCAAGGGAPVVRVDFIVLRLVSLKASRGVVKMIQIIRMSELEEGTAVAAQAEGVELVVVKCNGRVSILEGRCPHQGAMLADGSVENSELVCNGRRWRFDCLTGEKLNNPKTCLKTFSARIEGDQVLVSEQEVIDWKRAVQKKATVDPARPAGLSLKDLPGPKGIPQLGNLLQLDLNQLHLILEKWCEYSIYYLSNFIAL